LDDTGAGAVVGLPMHEHLHTGDQVGVRKLNNLELENNLDAK
jgi:hypothetical protein